MEERFYIDINGKYLGSYTGPEANNPYLTETEILVPPNNGKDTWNFSTQSWDAYTLSVEEQLVSTENVEDLFKKVEELIDNVQTNKPLSQETKNWVINRKTIRGE